MRIPRRINLRGELEEVYNSGKSYEQGDAEICIAWRSEFVTAEATAAIGHDWNGTRILSLSEGVLLHSVGSLRIQYLSAQL